MSDITIVNQDKEVVKKSYNIYNYINNICLINNVGHFDVCDCCREEYNIIYNDLLKNEEFVQIHEKRIGESIKKHRLRLLPIKVKNILLSVIDKPCPFEVDELSKTVKIFSEKYDLGDARVFSIVKSVLDLQLTAFRMQRESSFRGVVLDRVDKDGNVTPILNPVEDVKRKYNESVVKAVDVLDKLVNGSKSVNFNIDFKEEMVNAYKKFKKG